MTVLQHVTTREKANLIRDYGFESNHGESGRGVYFFSTKSHPMMDYYWRVTPNPTIINVRITEPILDLTKPIVKKQLRIYAKQYYDRLSIGMGDGFIKPKVDDYIYKNPYLIEDFMNIYYSQYQVYITRHFGSGVPDSKQYIVRNPRIIKIVSIR